MIAVGGGINKSLLGCCKDFDFHLSKMEFHWSVEQRDDMFQLLDSREGTVL